MWRYLADIRAFHNFKRFHHRPINNPEVTGHEVKDKPIVGFGFHKVWRDFVNVLQIDCFSALGIDS